MRRLDVRVTAGARREGARLAAPERSRERASRCSPCRSAGSGPPRAWLKCSATVPSFASTRTSSSIGCAGEPGHVGAPDERRDAGAGAPEQPRVVDLELRRSGAQTGPVDTVAPSRRRRRARCCAVCAATAGSTSSVSVGKHLAGRGDGVPLAVELDDELAAHHRDALVHLLEADERTAVGSRPSCARCAARAPGSRSRRAIRGRRGTRVQPPRASRRRRCVTDAPRGGRATGREEARLAGLARGRPAGRPGRATRELASWSACPAPGAIEHGRCRSKDQRAPRHRIDRRRPRGKLLQTSTRIAFFSCKGRSTPARPGLPGLAQSRRTAAAQSTLRYLSSSHCVSWMRYSSHSLRLSFT